MTQAGTNQALEYLGFFKWTLPSATMVQTARRGIFSGFTFALGTLTLNLSRPLDPDRIQLLVSFAIPTFGFFGFGSGLVDYSQANAAVNPRITVDFQDPTTTIIYNPGQVTLLGLPG